MSRLGARKGTGCLLHVGFLRLGYACAQSLDKIHHTDTAETSPSIEAFSRIHLGFCCIECGLAPEWSPVNLI